MKIFGTSHLLTLACFAFAGWLLISCARRGQRWPVALMAFLCLAALPMSQLAYRSYNFSLPLVNTVPFHLCDIAAICAGFALVTRRPLLCELTYCWGLAGTAQALLTPNLTDDFPHPVAFSFFLHHGAIVVAALMLPIALKWRPRDGIVPRIFLWNQVYFIGAFAVNLALGTNFGFLMAPPETGSALDYFGPWPWYLIPLQVIAIGVMAVLNLPFRHERNIWRVPRNRSKPSV